MIDLALLIGGAALPSAVLIVVFYRADRARPEPVGLIWRSVFYGFVAAVPAVFLERLVNLPAGLFPPLASAAWTAFVTAAAVEEGVKYFFLKRYLLRNPAFDEVMDGIVYAASVSLGFAFAENIVYGLGDGGSLALRAFTAVPMHASCTGIMGYWLGLARRAASPADAAAARRRGVLWAVALHGSYDFFLMLGSSLAWLALAVLVGAALGVRRCVRKAKALDDADAVLRGSLR